MTTETAEEILERKGWDLDALYSEYGIHFKRKTIYVHHCGIVSQKTETTKITVEAVIEYYRTEARNITSGCRTIAGIVGDWRPIDYLAKQCLEVYKVLQLEKLRKVARANGMELRS